MADPMGGEQVQGSCPGIVAVEAREGLQEHGWLAWRVVARSRAHSQMGAGQQNQPCSGLTHQVRAGQGDMGRAASQGDD